MNLQFSKLLRLIVCLSLFTAVSRIEADDAWRGRLELAGENRAQIEQAWNTIAVEQRPGLEFLLLHMPEKDLRQLSAEFLLDNCRLAYMAWQAAPWRSQIDEPMFFNEILPYACVNEVRDSWRQKFYEELRPLIEDCQTPGQAAVKLNQQIFSKYQVKYSTQRRKAIQSPAESMETGLASCSGLSIMLVDACRAVGVPARFVGVPRWTDNSGNHSWVEIWDGDWKFTGAAEPNGDQLNATWFNGRAAQQKRDEAMYAIYAASFRETPVKFPMFSRRNDSAIFAVNVTDRYTSDLKSIADNQQWLRIRAVDSSTRERLAVSVVVSDSQGQILGDGQTKDERFDRNDHFSLAVAKGKTVQVKWTWQAEVQMQEVTLGDTPSLVSATFANEKLSPATDGSALTELKAYLRLPRAERPELAQQSFAEKSLTPKEADQASQLLWQDFVAEVRETRTSEMEKKQIEWQEWKMPFAYSVHGESPVTGRRLFISMHGGGEAPARVNDRQWENQKKLYSPEEGIYLAPRAPTNSWNMWHQGHIDPLYDRLITNLIVFENVNPDCVYLLGYSAGGDGVYQVAPRMADRFAAAAMMAGHPNEAQPLSLRNLPFAIHMGANDSAFKRNEVAASWGKRLTELRQEDAEGYESFTKLHEGKGHWMDRQDGEAVAWLAAKTRNVWPTKIVWHQDDVTHDRFYWLTMPPGIAKAGLTIRAECIGQKIVVVASEETPIGIRFSGKLVDLSRPVEIVVNDKAVFQGLVSPKIAVIAKSIRERGDPSGIAVAEWNIPASEK